MKVIAEGKPWTMKVTCTGSGNNNVGCGAKLEVSQGDIYQTTSSSYDGSSDNYNTFMCPCCGAETDIKVPYSVKLLGKRPSDSQKKALVLKFNQSKLAMVEDAN